MVAHVDSWLCPQLVGRLEAVVKAYGRLLRQYLKGSEEQVDILLTLEEFCSEEAPFGPASHGKRFVPVFARVRLLEACGIAMMPDRTSRVERL